MTGEAHGAVVPVATLHRLGVRWYADRLDADWRRATVAERQRMLDEVGLTGAFWQLA